MNHGTVNYDFLTVKYNSDGIQQWEARYNGPANDEEETPNVLTDIEGNVYIAGSSKGTEMQGIDFAIVKYNSEGVLQWVSRYNSSSYQNDYLSSMALDNFGNIFVTGTAYGFLEPSQFAT